MYGYTYTLKNKLLINWMFTVGDIREIWNHFDKIREINVWKN